MFRLLVYCLARYGASCCSTRCDVGTTQVHLDLEKKVAEFVGQTPPPGLLLTNLPLCAHLHHRPSPIP
jgi:7-keto-8-aminopelargonate synthetase-like enzyme